MKYTPSREVQLENALAQQYADEWVANWLNQILTNSSTPLTHSEITFAQHYERAFAADRQECMQTTTKLSTGIDPLELAAIEIRAKDIAPSYITSLLDQLARLGTLNKFPTLTDAMYDARTKVDMMGRAQDHADHEALIVRGGARDEPEAAESPQAREVRRTRTWQRREVLGQIPDALTESMIEIEQTIVQANAAARLLGRLNDMLAMAAKERRYLPNSREDRLVNDFLGKVKRDYDSSVDTLDTLRTLHGEALMDEVASLAVNNIEVHVHQQLEGLQESAASRGMGELTEDIERLMQQSLHNGRINERSQYEAMKLQGGPKDEVEVRRARGEDGAGRS